VGVHLYADRSFLATRLLEVSTRFAASFLGRCACST
jgi:hypothetical protein